MFAEKIAIRKGFSDSENSAAYHPMKSHSSLPFASALLSAVSEGLHAERVALSDCPETVLATIRRHASTDQVGDIGTIHRKDRTFYLVEIDHPDYGLRRLQIASDGAIYSVADGVGVSGLPAPVRSAVDCYLSSGARFDAADRVSTSGMHKYHVELDIGDNVDLHLFLDEGGAVLRRHEVADF